MERHANYALVGIMTTILTIVGLVFIVWLGGFNAVGQDSYRVIFKGPVSGLKEGGSVSFNGIKVGEIERVDLVPEDGTLIAVDIKLKKGTPVRTDSVASTSTQGISGVSAVTISAGTTVRPLLKETSRSNRPVIPSKQSSMAALLDSGGKVVEGANEAIGRVNRLLSDRNIEALGDAMQDMRAVTAELAAHRAMFGDAAQAIRKLDSAVSDIQKAAGGAQRLINGDGKDAVANIAGAASELKLTLRDARGVIAKLDGQTGDLGTTTLPAINATMRSIQQASDSLDSLIRQIRNDPRSTLGKSRGKELELPK